MSAISLTITLPESLKAFIDQQVAKGGYGSADAYIQSLVREAQTHCTLDGVPNGKTSEDDSDEALKSHCAQFLAHVAKNPAVKERIEALLLEALESESSPMTARDWEDIRREGLERLAARKPV